MRQLKKREYYLSSLLLNVQTNLTLLNLFMCFCSNFCIEGTLDPKKAKGTILVCHRGGSLVFNKCTQATSVGAVGIIILNNAFFGNEMYVEPYLCPATHISYSDGLQVSSYVNSTRYNKESMNLALYHSTTN